MQFPPPSELSLPGQSPHRASLPLSCSLSPAIQGTGQLVQVSQGLGQLASRSSCHVGPGWPGPGILAKCRSPWPPAERLLAGPVGLRTPGPGRAAVAVPGEPMGTQTGTWAGMALASGTCAGPAATLPAGPMPLPICPRTPCAAGTGRVFAQAPSWPVHSAQEPWHSGQGPIVSTSTPILQPLATKTHDVPHSPRPCSP